jgi:hypothetical protein
LFPSSINTIHGPSASRFLASHPPFFTINNSNSSSSYGFFLTISQEFSIGSSRVKMKKVAGHSAYFTFSNPYPDFFVNF